MKGLREAEWLAWCVLPQGVILGAWAAIPAMRAWQATSSIAGAMLIAAIAFPVVAWRRVGRGGRARASASVLIAGWLVGISAAGILFVPIFRGDG